MLSPKDAKAFCDLAGVSTEVVVSVGRQSFKDKLLITHQGFSGPAMLQISSYWQAGEKLRVDWAPGAEVLLPMLASPGGARRGHGPAEAAPGIAHALG